jgi:hypothetical protein
MALNGAQRYSTFGEFYEFYLTQHENPVCRLLHVMGVLGAAGVLVFSAVRGAWGWTALAPVVGYGCGWTGHFVFEGNRPASFRQPWFSLLGDLLMTTQVLSGKLSLGFGRHP